LANALTEESLITGNKEEIVEAIDIKANGVSRFDRADFLPTDFLNKGRNPYCSA
jgi:hypothetical protein